MGTLGLSAQANDIRHSAMIPAGLTNYNPFLTLKTTKPSNFELTKHMQNWSESRAPYDIGIGSYDKGNRIKIRGLREFETNSEAMFDEKVLGKNRRNHD